MDMHLIAQIEQTLAQVGAPLRLLDGSGNCLIPADDTITALPEKWLPDAPTPSEGLLFLRAGKQNDLILCLKDEGQASRDTLILAGAMIDALAQFTAATNDMGNAYQRILQDECSVAELDAVVSEYRIPSSLRRCVLLMHMVKVEQRDALAILADVLPQSQGDMLVGMDRHTAALIRNVSDIDDEDELRQYALAAQETLLSETALPVTVGIGEIADDISQLHQSYRQARRAIEIGRVFRPDESVYVYRSMMLERFLADLTPEVAAHYHGLLFSRKTARLFSEEMLYTIEMFFKKDLNLSDTARQLYIHRNTLVYRLDKVQKQIGLDLRKFEDAVTFKMLLEMKKCVGNKPRK